MASRIVSADGNKIISKDKYGKHYVVRISLVKTNDSLIAEKCIRIIKAIGLIPTTLCCGNCLTIKISSKLLFNALYKIPEKSSATAAFVAGAIDGDGWLTTEQSSLGNLACQSCLMLSLTIFKDTLC